MSRQFELVTQSELSAILTAELQKIEDCAGSVITVKYRLQEPDDEGCNWSDDVSIRVGPKASSSYVIPHVEGIVRRARARYNLVEG